MKTIFSIITIYTLIACQKPNPQNYKSTKITLSTSIPPQAYIINEITKPLAKINIMIKDTQNPHTYNPNPKQIQTLLKSNAYIKMNTPHLPLENKINKILIENHIKIINMNKNIKLIYKKHNQHQNPDPHTWLSTNNIKIAARNIYNEIIKIDPHNKNIYHNNLNNFIKNINNTKKQITQILTNINNKYFLIYHPTLAYFAKENNLIQIAIEKEGKNISIQNIKQINKKIKLHKINTLLIQKGFNPKITKTIAKENNLNIIEINPLKQNILNNLKNIALVIKQISN